MSVQPDEVAASEAPLIEHLIELRQRIIAGLIAFFIAFVLCFFIIDYLLAFLLWPYEWATKLSGGNPADLHLQATEVWETILTKMRLAAFGAIVFSFPYVAFQLYSFIAPGLYKNEKMAFVPFLICSPILFVIGAIFVYGLVAPIILWFSLSQQIVAGSSYKIEFIAKISSYVGFMTSFMIIFGIIFQLPLITTLLTKVGLLTSNMLVTKRKWAFLAAVIIAAIVTPSDLITMFGVALPIVLLYEVSIIASRWMEKRQLKQTK